MTAENTVRVAAETTVSVAVWLLKTLCAWLLRTPCVWLLKLPVPCVAAENTVCVAAKIARPLPKVVSALVLPPERRLCRGVFHIADCNGHTTCTGERSFSAVPRLEKSLHSSMAQRALKSAILPYEHKERCDRMSKVVLLCE